MLADLNPYFMAGHLVPWQRATGANEDTAGRSSCAAQFTHMPLMSSRRQRHAEPATSLISTIIDQQTQTFTLHVHRHIP